ncbi:hypothetical protein GARC_5219 [Paraglaciecola arctica BSs20135]|uniref:Uncharacterized protein n=1 Tax=Paraglaciecola arctica BSs20135 TaxID=493475 RepID=K6XNB1_9ALTE|nr:hypothetical protein GARC_5219 [Paraglaciecola arctica BSs20135]
MHYGFKLAVRVFGLLWHVAWLRNNNTVYLSDNNNGLDKMRIKHRG